MSYGYEPKNFPRSDVPVNRPGSRTVSPDASGRGRGDPRASAALVGQAVLRLSELVEQETAALRNGRFSEIAEFGARKNHALLELSRMMPLPSGTEQDRVLTAKLTTLRQTLDANRSLVQKHIMAVQEVSDLIANVVQQHDSDGTYSKPMLHGGYGE